jgi:hypothetical protein
MTILRRNLFRIWVLCGLLWLTFVCDRFYEIGPPDAIDFLITLLVTIPLLLAGLRLAPTWEFIGSYWHGLPVHLRRGMTRLYLVVSVPWVAWYGYQLIDATQHDYYISRRVIPHAFWLLVSVPIGGPILLVVIVWVLNGFRASPNTSETGSIKKGGGVSPQPRAGKPST